MPRGGRRKNQTGRPSPYTDPASINFRCERELKARLDSYLVKSDCFKNRSELISFILNNWLANQH